MPVVVIHSEMHGAAITQALSDLTEFDVRLTIDDVDCSNALAHASVLVIAASDFSAPIARAVRQSRSLRHLHLLTSGRDGLTRHGCVPDHLIVTNLAEAIGPMVAEHAMALLLSLRRGLHIAERLRQAERWDREGLIPALWTLSGAQVTVVGYGAIGRRVARMADAFGARITVVRRYLGARADGFDVAGLD